MRFESQFTAMVDSQNVPAITKFSHLKELLTAGIRSTIDGLPFNEEGYFRAIKFLRDKYGNPNEIAGAYVINLLEVPAITDRDVTKINQFYEKLFFNIDCLETLEKARNSTRSCILRHR